MDFNEGMLALLSKRNLEGEIPIRSLASANKPMFVKVVKHVPKERRSELMNSTLHAYTGFEVGYNQRTGNAAFFSIMSSNGITREIILEELNKAMKDTISAELKGFTFAYNRRDNKLVFKVTPEMNEQITRQIALSNLARVPVEYDAKIMGGDIEVTYSYEAIEDSREFATNLL